jgi:hypothetical protein
MSLASIIERARAAFAAELASPPPLSLRGGNDVDGYRRAAPFDPVEDQPTDDYLEGYAFWALAYLDAKTWRHYLPQLIAYAGRHGDDPRMVVEALVRSLRPPDRYPPRLTTLDREQEAVVRAFLEHLAVDPAWERLRTEAQHALDEWWSPNAHSRPTREEINALRAAPLRYRTVGAGSYRLELPESLAGGGIHDIPEESRRVETWGGLLCGDAHTVVAINVMPLSVRSLVESVEYRRAQFRDNAAIRRISVPGSSDARCLEGFIDGDSPADPQAFTVVLASSGAELMMLSVRTWPRDDLQREVEKIARSLRLLPATL